MAARQCVLTLFAVESPAEMQSKIEGCLFYRRCLDPKSVAVDGAVITLSFLSTVPRVAILKNVAQTIRGFGAFERYVLVEGAAPLALPPVALALPSASSASSASSAPAALAALAALAAPAAPAEPACTLLAVQGVEAIKRMAAGMSHAECHALAFWFATRCMQAPVVTSLLGRTLDDKRAAAHIFELPPSEWLARLTVCAEAYPTFDRGCDCRCNCSNGVASSMCLRCGNFVCNHCYVNPNRCHHCEAQPKNLEVALTAPSTLDGLRWYFNSPSEGANYFEHPAKWCVMNRDTTTDPLIVDIVDIWKWAVLEGSARLARPMFWQHAFYFRVQFSGGVVVPINMSTFIMNRVWKAHPLVKFVEDWLVEQPDHLEFRGSLLRPRAMQPRVVEDPPRRSRLPPCTVHIEELESTALEDARNQALVAELERGALERGALERRMGQAADSDGEGSCYGEELREALATAKRERSEENRKVAERLLRRRSE